MTANAIDSVKPTGFTSPQQAVEVLKDMCYPNAVTVLSEKQYFSYKLVKKQYDALVLAITALEQKEKLLKELKKGAFSYKDTDGVVPSIIFSRGYNQCVEEVRKVLGEL